MIVIPLAQAKMDSLPAGSVRFLYLNSPVNPTGQVASLDYLTQLVEFARRNGITVLHDMDSWYTHHAPAFKLHNILEVPGAMDCCVTVLSVSKEFGLPGLRVGLIAGNAAVNNAIRMHNSTFTVMIPEVCQVAAQAALESLIDDVSDDNKRQSSGQQEGRNQRPSHISARTNNFGLEKPRLATRRHPYPRRRIQVSGVRPTRPFPTGPLLPGGVPGFLHRQPGPREAFDIQVL
jgi:aspartate/methionine/tyrosine aminotransferase